MGEKEQDMNAGTYAVITGASQGLGRAFAEECARYKLNLVLTALPGEQLDLAAGNLKEQYNVEVIIYETDLSQEQNCISFFDFVQQKNIPITLLINNAGVGSIGTFESFPAEFYQLQVKLNTLIPVLLTRLFLPVLKKQTSAFILNVSSLANFFFIPGKEVYGATKSFLYSFSLSLRNSLRRSSVSVSVVCPGGIDTNERVRLANSQLKGVAKRSILSPGKVAKYTLARVFQKKAIIIPGTINRITLIVNRCLPSVIKNKLISHTARRQSYSDINQ